MKNSARFFVFINIIVIFFFSVSPVSAVLPRTQTLWTTTNEDGVDVIPYVRVDKKALFVDFEDKNFSNIEYIYYNLKYDSDGSIKRGIEGSFVPVASDYFGYYQGRPYFRRELVLGTCSKGVCTYHQKPHNVKLTINTNLLSGKIDQYTKVLSFPDDQFTLP